MQRTQFRSHPAVSGIGYGFFELAGGGRRAVQHGGGWIGFGSLLRLLPDEGFGLFVSYNHGLGLQLGQELADAVVDRGKHRTRLRSFPGYDAGFSDAKPVLECDHPGEPRGGM